MSASRAHSTHPRGRSSQNAVAFAGQHGLVVPMNQKQTLHALFEINELEAQLLELVDEVFELKTRLLADHAPAPGKEEPGTK